MEMQVGKFKVEFDDEDWQRIKQHRWWVFNNRKLPRVVATIKGKRVSLAQWLKPPPPGMLCYFKDDNPLNHRQTNIQHATKAQVTASMKARRSRSGLRGVTLRVIDGREYFQVSISGDFIGVYRDKNEAAEAYNKAAVERYGEFAVLNPIYTYQCTTNAQDELGATDPGADQSIEQGEKIDPGANGASGEGFSGEVVQPRAGV